MIKIIIVLMLFFSCSFVYSKDYYIPDDFKTLDDIFANCKYGDTFIIRDGEYPINLRMFDIDISTPIPMNQCIRIKAENPGKVIFTQSKSPVIANRVFGIVKPLMRCHWIIEGIKWE